jgi:hypothetical protein
VNVILDEAGQQRPALKVDDLGCWADRRLDIITTADAKNSFAVHRQRFGNFVP